MENNKPQPNPRDEPPKSIGDEEIPDQDDPKKDDIGDPTHGKKIEDPCPEQGKKIKLPPDPDQKPEKSDSF